MKKLPIGVYTFRDIIEDNYIYVDKTKEAYELINSYKYVFLSRPRGFGKTLFLDTLHEIFNSSKELFKGLYIYDKHDFEAYPVIRIGLIGGLANLDSVKRFLLDVLRENQEILGIECEKRENPFFCFRELIRKAYKKYNKKVVILIDDYDKPVFDKLDNPYLAKELAEFLAGFYSVIKDSDRYIKFAFLTGVIKFHTAFSNGLDNLADISLKPEYSKICGFTYDNLTNEFKEYLKDVNLDEVKSWYNGYNYLGENKIFNSYDILQFINNNYIFSNYWFKAVKPKFLPDILRKLNYNVIALENFDVEDLDNLNIDDIDVGVILFYLGFLTIKDIKEEILKPRYILSYPNKEVKMSISNYILKEIFRVE